MLSQGGVCFQKMAAPDIAWLSLGCFLVLKAFLGFCNLQHIEVNSWTFYEGFQKSARISGGCLGALNGRLMFGSLGAQEDYRPEPPTNLNQIQGAAKSDP